MIIEDRIKAFEKLGYFLMDFCYENPNSNHPLETIIKSSYSCNGWFTSSNIRSSTGLAVNWFTPVGPLTFSYAIPITSESTDKKESFRFKIGTSF